MKEPSEAPNADHSYFRSPTKPTSNQNTSGDELANAEEVVIEYVLDENTGEMRERVSNPNITSEDEITYEEDNVDYVLDENTGEMRERIFTDEIAGILICINLV